MKTTDKLPPTQPINKGRASAIARQTMDEMLRDTCFLSKDDEWNYRRAVWRTLRMSLIVQDFTVEECDEILGEEQP